MFLETDKPVTAIANLKCDLLAIGIRNGKLLLLEPTALEIVSKLNIKTVIFQIKECKDLLILATAFDV